jgi:UMF1 family MFS transporter
MKEHLIVNKRSVIAWALFDWALSPFAVLITTFVFSTYFTEKVAINKIIGTSQWGMANGTAGLIVAFLSPCLGAIANRQGRNKPWLYFLTLIIFISSFALWFVKPDPSFVHLALFWIILGTTAVELCSVFYNALLNEVSPPSYLGRISGWGWGTGYAGGLVTLVIMLYFILNDSVTIRICGPLVAVWLMVFSWPLFLFVKEKPGAKLSVMQIISEGFQSLGKTLKLLRRDYRNVFHFLIARMFFIDGIVTIFAFGGIYAAGVIHMTTIQIIQFGIAMNVAAGIGAAAFGWVDDALGPKETILLALILMIASGIGMLMVDRIGWFWLFGMGLSLGFGPAQAAGRSLLIRISPPELITEFFGLYNLSGRVTTFMGPWILALFTSWFKSQRVGMGTVFIFLIVGTLLLCRVSVKKYLVQS